MRLHISTVDKLISMFETYGGHRNQQRLKAVLTELDLTEYERSNGEKILVSTDDLEKEQTEANRK